MQVKDIADLTGNVEFFERETNENRYFIYLCIPCEIQFGVTQDLEDQSSIKCPRCTNENVLDGGEALIRRIGT